MSSSDLGNFRYLNVQSHKPGQLPALFPSFHTDGVQGAPTTEFYCFVFFMVLGLIAEAFCTR